MECIEIQHVAMPIAIGGDVCRNTKQRSTIQDMTIHNQTDW